MASLGDCLGRANNDPHRISGGLYGVNDTALRDDAREHLMSLSSGDDNIATEVLGLDDGEFARLGESVDPEVTR